MLESESFMTNSVGIVTKMTGIGKVCWNRNRNRPRSADECMCLQHVPCVAPWCLICVLCYRRPRSRWLCYCSITTRPSSLSNSWRKAHRSKRYGLVSISLPLFNPFHSGYSRGCRLPFHSGYDCRRRQRTW